MWASLDVAFLYTSIPHNICLKAIQHFLNKSGDFHSFQSQFLVQSVEFCWKHNYFTFCEQFYLQCRGMVMGANFAPVYAKLTMGHWEEDNIWANNPFAKFIVYFGRYIDDIVLIWSGGPEKFSSFVAYCNSNTFGLTFTHVLNSQQLVFFDRVPIHDEDRIVTRNHIKPTSGNSYLHFDSGHHPTQK